MTDTAEDKQWEERFARAKEAYGKMSTFTFEAEQKGLINRQTERELF